MKKRFSMRNKLLIIFGLLIAVAAIIEGLLAVQTARKAVIEKIETHLTDKATDTAEIIDGRIDAFFQFLEGIARMPLLRDFEKSYFEKMESLEQEAACSKIISNLYLIEKNGMAYFKDGSEFSYAHDTWFLESKNGKNYITEPFYDETIGNVFAIGLSVPIYDDNKNIIGVLYADIDGLWLSNQIDDIVVGKTGECYILGLTGITIAQKNDEIVKKQDNIIENAKKITAFESLAAFTRKALASDKIEIGYYQYNNIKNIATFVKMKTTKWNVIIKAPVHEFMGSVQMLRGGEGVAEEMRKLDDLTRVITDSMNEMASGAVQISNAVQDVNEITQKNKASIDNLAKEVKKFKV